MALKQLGKLWRRTSKSSGKTYWAAKFLESVPAQTTLLIFRGAEQDDGSCGSVCIAVDDDQPARHQTPQEAHAEENPFKARQKAREQRQRNQARSGGQHATPPTDNRDDPGGFRRETAEIAANPSPIDILF